MKHRNNNVSLLVAVPDLKHLNGLRPSAVKHARLMLLIVLKPRKTWLINMFRGLLEFRATTRLKTASTLIELNETNRTTYPLIQGVTC